MAPRKPRSRQLPRSLRPGAACVNWVFWSASVADELRSRGWSKQALADHLGLSRMDVSHACRGRGVSVPTYLALCKLFNLDPLEYFYRVSIDVELTQVLDEAHRESSADASP